MAICVGLGSKVVLFGGELGPSDRWESNVLCFLFCVFSFHIFSGVMKELVTSVPRPTSMPLLLEGKWPGWGSQYWRDSSSRGQGEGNVYCLCLGLSLMLPYRIWDMVCVFVCAKLCAKLCADTKICTKIFEH